MASSDTELVDEVRVITHYDTDLVPQQDILDTIALAKEELKAEVDDSTLTFYSGNLQADRALFWLTCIFLKVRMGELDAPNISIGELKVRQSSFTERTGIWWDNFNQYLASMNPGARMGHTTITRADRTYQFDN